MADGPRQRTSHQVVRENFLRILVEDVIISSARREKEDSQANRRDLIRTVFAAVEGLVWTYRTEIVEISRSTGILTVEEEQAFAERTFSVNQNGRISAQPKFVPMPAMIRLTSRLANRLDPAFEADFSGAGWDQLMIAVKTRNRITHPKRGDDLIISEIDMTTCLGAFHWLLELTASAMEAATAVFRDHLKQMRAIISGLASGDPEMMALYKNAERSLDSED